MARFDLIDLLSDGALIADARTLGVLDANDRICFLLGYRRDQLPGLRLDDLLSPADLPRLERQVAQVADGQSTLLSGASVLHRDRTRLVVDVTAARLTLEDAPRIVCVFRVPASRGAEDDVPGHAEDRRTLLIESLDDGYGEVDLTGRLVRVNQAFCRLLGYTADELLATTYPDLTVPHWREVEQRILAQQVLEAGQSAVYEKEYFRKDGSIVPVELRVSAWKDQQGVVTGMWGIVRDLSERRRATTALLAERDRLRQILDSQLGLTAILDLDGRTVDMNEVAVVASGWTRAQVLGVHICDVPWAPPDIDSLVRESIAAAARGEVVRIDVAAITSDGDRREFDDVFYPIRDARGHIVNVALFGVDVTDRRRAERELARSNLRLREAQAAASLGNWEHDHVTGRLWWSDEVFRIAERDPAALAPHFDGYWQLVHPDDLERVRAAYQRGVDTGEPYRLVYRWITPGGRVKYVESSGSTESAADGRPLRSQGTVQDVTARIEMINALEAARDDLSATLMAIPDPLVEIDGQGRLIRHRSTRQALPLALDGDAGHGRAEWLPPEAARGLALAIERARVEGASAGEQVRIDSDSGPRWFELTVARKTAAGGVEPTYLVLSRDVTERHLAEQRLRRSLTEKDVMLRELHHRVKNNLQIISSLLYFISRRMRSPEDAAAVADGRERLRALALVHERLYESQDLSRLDFGDYLRSLVAQLAEAYGRIGVGVVARVEAAQMSVPISLAQPAGLVVAELVVNAFKHGFPGGRPGEVLVSVAATDDGGVRLGVADTGVGLPADFVPARAESFGWRLVYALARQVGARIEVSGAAGTTVTLRIPRESIAAAEPVEAHLSPALPGHA